MSDFNFNPDNVIQPFVEKGGNTPRNKCHDLEGALEYVKETVDEMKKSDEWKWIFPMDDGSTTVAVKLHSMPLYWTIFPHNQKDEVTILNPDMSFREKRPAIVGGTLYTVANKDQGKALLEALASGKNDALNEVLERAAIALKEVDEIELPHTLERAEILYKEAELDRTAFGTFSNKDDTNPKNGRKRISQEKTNKMNTLKQRAKRQLGYERLKQEEKTEEQED